MRRQPFKISALALLWGTCYIIGSLMCIVTIAALWGANWAGSFASFLIIGGTVLLESFNRRKYIRSLQTNLDEVNSRQKFMNREISLIRNDMDGLKDDMVQTAMSLQRESRKIQPSQSSDSHPTSDNPMGPESIKDAPSTPAGLFDVMQKSLMKMGMKSQSRQNLQKSTSFLPHQKPANTSLPEANNMNDQISGRNINRMNIQESSNHHILRAQKYRDIVPPSSQNATSEFQETGSQEDSFIPEYSPAVLSELIFHAVMNDKIEIFAQPIVRLPSRKICYLELFARIRAKAGIYLPAQTYRTLAQQESQLETLDHLLLLHTIDTLRADARRNQSIGYFINIYSGTLKNSYFMNDLLEFIRARRDLLQHLVFEFQYDDFTNFSPAYIKILTGLHQLGCLFSLDNIKDTAINSVHLKNAGIKFVKMNGNHLIELCKTAAGEMEMARLKSRLDAAGLRLIVERLENEQSVIDLLDFEIDYGEGHFFGKPDLEVAYRKYF